MKTAPFEDVLKAYSKVENKDPYQLWAVKKANELSTGHWLTVELTQADFSKIILPCHRHPEQGYTLVKPEGATLAQTLDFLKSSPGYAKSNKPCWQTIEFLKDNTQPVFLSTSPIPNQDYQTMGQFDGDCLYHVDGLHRLLAAGLFSPKRKIMAFVATI